MQEDFKYLKTIEEMALKTAEEQILKNSYIAQVGELQKKVQELEAEIKELKENEQSHTQENEYHPDDVTVETTQYTE